MFIVSLADPDIELNELMFHKPNSTTLCRADFLLLIRIYNSESITEERSAAKLAFGLKPPRAPPTICPCVLRMTMVGNCLAPNCLKAARFGSRKILMPPVAPQGAFHWASAASVLTQK